MSAIAIHMSQCYKDENPFSNLGRVTMMIGFSIFILCTLFAIKMIRNYREMEELIYKQPNDDLLDLGI